MKLPALIQKLSPTSYRQAFVALGLGAAALVVIFGDGQLDLAWATVYFNGLSSDFPLHASRWVQRTLYLNGKAVAIVLNLALLAAVIATAASGGLRWRIAAATAFGMFAIPVSVAALKALSAAACPWDVTLFGGPLAHVPLLAWPDAQPAGHCMPAGHPSAGLALLGLVLPMLAAGHIRLARVATILAFSMGAAMGWLRMLQGAHFVSHVLWTFWVAMLVSLITAQLFALPWPWQTPKR